MQISGELKIEKINVCWAGLKGKVGKETSARPLLSCCPLSAMPRDTRTFVPYVHPLLPSPCPGVTTGGCDFLRRPHHQCSVATMCSGLGHPPSPSAPRCVPLSTLGGHQPRVASGDTAMARAGSAELGETSRVMGSSLLLNTRTWVCIQPGQAQDVFVPKLAFSLYSRSDLDVTSAVTGLVQ